ncbi:MAG: hypothetical protein KME60_21740 [Cyanomargarita calcarea GSE-NOS-MK-12-04C]|jgi:diadenosine tetraphosphate (Ap4A) HIT family hydrolase|uniref:Uncharacterized protein n=1 Tax=Cyanomargarita calcarea GSE-NOS-MK-12-04C TaxID=2839659 RepID=A0A951QQU7_9CYAN|nr:hypothetical protein [Cyanomargarita calcarea GSE-NOS-MK-12-04C]
MPILTKENSDYIYETKFWVVLLAWKQIFPRLVVFAKPNISGIFYENLSQMPIEVIIDFQNNVIKKIEPAFLQLFAGDVKEDFVANWFCMMNDAYKEYPPKPQVHWHFKARIRNPIKIAQFQFTDPAFGHFPPRKEEKQLPEIDGTPEERLELIKIIRSEIQKIN